MRNELDIVQLALFVEVLLLHTVEVLALALSGTVQVLLVAIDLQLQRCALGRLAQVLAANRLRTFGLQRVRGRRFHGLLFVRLREGRRIVGRIGLAVLVGLVGFFIVYLRGCGRGSSINTTVIIIDD